MRAKVGGFNDQLAADASTASLALTESDILELDQLVVYLTAKLASNGKESAEEMESDFGVAVRLLRWPASLRFPGEQPVNPEQHWAFFTDFTCLSI